MRLLIDEMYPAAIAEQLRFAGNDVVAVVERPELRTLPDLDLFEVTQGERRTLVTENIGDFARIVAAYEQSGRTHFGVVFVDPGKFPRGNRRTIGRMVKALGAFLDAHPQSRPTSLRHWL